MSGYKRVNYYELCRLCTSSEGTKMHIFREEGRRRQLPTKIQVCLPLQVCENDSLPKIICTHCADKLDSFYDFRETCVNAEQMLESFFNTIRYPDYFQKEGKVYIKDDPPKKKQQTSLGLDPEFSNDQSSQNLPIIVSVSGATGQEAVKIAAVNPVIKPITVETLPAIQIVTSTVDEQESFKDQIEQQTVAVSTSCVQHDQSDSRYDDGYQNSALDINSTIGKNNGHNNNNNDDDDDDLLGEHCKSDGITQTDFPGAQIMTLKVENGHDFRQQLHQQQSGTSSSLSDDGDTSGANTTVAVTTATLQQAIALHHSQEMLAQFGFNSKDKETVNTAALFRAEDVLNRSSMAQIGEFLRMKTVAMVGGLEGGDGSLPIESMCQTCGKELSSAEELAAHMDNCQPESLEGGGGVEAGEDRAGSNPCEVCGKTFKRKEHLFQHRKLHTGERPYSCGSCGKSFSRKEHLVRHSVSHTGQKVHTCDLCGKSFSRKDNLHKHKKTHGVAGPYVCELCGKSFVVKHYYIMHRATHDAADSSDDIILPHRCDICTKAFATSKNLAMHRARHRNKSRATQENVVTSNDDRRPADGSPPPESSEAPLETIDAEGILSPDVLHGGASVATSATSTPVFQVTSAGGQTYICTPGPIAADQIMETYRRMNSS